MTDEEFEKQRSRIRELATWWQPKLALNEWHVDYHFHRVSSDMPEGGMNAIALCKTHWEYKLASIHWDVSAAEDSDDEQLERILVHELMHVHLAETQEPDKDGKHNERVATELALSFVFLKRELLPSGETP